MLSCTYNIIRNAIKSDEPRNIIVAPYDGIFELELCETTSHNYYLLTEAQRLKQPVTQHPRLHYLTTNLYQWSQDFEPDLIICNDIISQINLCNDISKLLHLPMIIVHHGIAPPFVKKEDMSILLNNYKYSHRVAIHPIINKSWYASFEHIPYGIINNIEKNTIIKEKKILIIGDFDPPSLNIVSIIQKKSHLPVTVYGNNPQASTPYTFNECLKLLQTHQVFINLFNDFELNQIMLYAMNAKCTIISSPSVLNNDIIQNGYNGYIASSLDDIVRLAHNTIIPTMGINAQNTIKQKFSTNGFQQSWNKLIDTLTHTSFRMP